MADIDDQLRSEITSLEEHIARTEDRFMATQWVAALLPSLQRLAGNLPEEELVAALNALRRARDRFHVNGQLSIDIDDLLSLYGDGAAREETGEAYSEALLTPADDPGDTAEGTAQALFEEEDEEEVTIGSRPEEQEPDMGTVEGLFSSAGERSTPGVLAAATEAVPEAVPPATQGPAGADDLFGTEEKKEPLPEPGSVGGEGQPTSEPDAQGIPERSSDELSEGAASLPPAPRFPEETTPGGPGHPSDELFDAPPVAPAVGLPDGAQREAPSRPRRGPKESAPGMPRQALVQVAASINIFSHTVALDDLQAALDFALPSQDLTQLENRLRARLTDKVVAALRESQLAEGQYILMPRIARFVHQGAVVPCTVRNLAKSYYKLFGDLRDLRPFVSDRVITSEVPELGWSLIAKEAPRESLGKSHMEQNQYVRYLATSLGIPSHLIRRRTLVEAVYDVIVGRLVLGQTLQRRTLDWTASSVSKSDFLCMYSADEGIRVRQLPRTTRHPALGVCPNW